MIESNRSSEIADLLRGRIKTMNAGDKLPGVRTLSATLHASAGTVSAALAELAAHGLVRSEPGRGTFVAEVGPNVDPDFAWQSQALGSKRVDEGRASRLGGYGGGGKIPLSWGYLASELQPNDDIRRIAARAAKSSHAWTMTDATGLPELRRVIAADFRADPDDVLVVSGGQQALVSVLRTLAEPGATVLTESPTYPGAIIAAQSAGLRLASVPSDGGGVRVDALADALERTRARVVYLQPNFANPSGAVLTAERRLEVVELARRHGAFLVEDDWSRHLCLEGVTPAPLSALDPDGHIVTIVTLSKPVSPGMRVGAVIARGPAGRRLRASRTADDLCVAPLMQEAAVSLLTSNAWPRHLKRIRPELIARRDALVSSLRAAMPELRIPIVPRGGLHLWARLPDGVDSTAVCAAADTAGVLVGDGRHFFVDEPPASFLRFSFGAATPAQIDEGVRRLSAVT